MIGYKENTDSPNISCVQVIVSRQVTHSYYSIVSTRIRCCWNHYWLSMDRPPSKSLWVEPPTIAADILTLEPANSSHWPKACDAGPMLHQPCLAVVSCRRLLPELSGRLLCQPPYIKTSRLLKRISKYNMFLLNDLYGSTNLTLHTNYIYDIKTFFAFFREFHRYVITFFQTVHSFQTCCYFLVYCFYSPFMHSLAINVYPLSRLCISPPPPHFDQ